MRTAGFAIGSDAVLTFPHPELVEGREMTMQSSTASTAPLDDHAAPA